jgi:hypothetical protein
LQSTVASQAGNAERTSAGDSVKRIETTAQPFHPQAADAPLSMRGIDPCTLVTAAEWQDNAGSIDGVPASLEEGEACGFKGDGDQVRMAIGIVASSELQYFLPSGMAAAGPIDVTADLNVDGVTREMWRTTRSRGRVRSPSPTSSSPKATHTACAKPEPKEAPA